MYNRLQCSRRMFQKCAVTSFRSHLNKGRLHYSIMFDLVRLFCRKVRAHFNTMQCNDLIAQREVCMDILLKWINKSMLFIQRNTADKASISRCDAIL